jgi:hypothetical protein
MSEPQYVDFNNVPGVLDWLAFILGGLGIGFTVVQLIRSRGALKAAAKALTDTRSTLIKNQLLSTLPAFEEISAVVDNALSTDPDRDPMQQALTRFCLHAQEAASLLKSSTNGQFDEVIREIVGTADEASQARAGLFSNVGATIHDIAGDAATSIRNLAPKIRGVAVDIRNDPGKGADA